ncbi:MAG: response regulator [Parvularculaceae bacterium]
MIAPDDLSPSSGDLIVLCDESDIIRFVSLSFAAIFGGGAGERANKTPGDWHGKVFAPGARAARGEGISFRTGGVAGGAIEWRLECLGSGEKLYAGRPDPAPDAAPGRAEAAEPGRTDANNLAAARDEARMKFIATLSHEMRTPLNGILGMATLLLDTGLNSNQRAYVDAVKQSGDGLLALINDLLDLSKLDAGKLQLERAPFDPYTLVQGVAELLAPRAAEKGIEIGCFVDPSTPRRLTGDEARIRQALLNLAGNAVKFTDDGGVAIEVRAEEDAGGVRLVLAVRDTGVGIPAEAQARLFEEFAQADDDAVRRSEGTGLGLAITRRLAHAMGGDVAVKSAPGKGSVFTLSIHAGAHADWPEVHRIDAPPVVIATRSTILARITRLQMQAFGAEKIRIIDDPKDVVFALREAPGALFLCDMEIAESLPRDAIALAGRAIVLAPVTAHGAVEGLRMKGFEGYLIKPVRHATLMREVARGPRRAEPAMTRTAPQKFDQALRVLLAEDNQINAVLATTLIRRGGHKVDVAANGVEAVAAAAAGGYDLIFMDMHMPEMDGLEASRRIRALPAPAGATPIVALTANAMAADRQKCLAAGMNDFLSKPFEPDDLTAMLAKWGTRRALDAAS